MVYIQKNILIWRGTLNVNDFNLCVKLKYYKIPVKIIVTDRQHYT